MPSITNVILGDAFINPVNYTVSSDEIVFV